MHPQVAAVREPLAALVAAEGPLPHVDVPLVGAQVPAAGEALAALAAPEGPLARVHARVHRQLGGRQEALVAHGAGVEPHPRVAEKVAALVGGVGEGLAAVRAGVGPRPPSHVAQRVGVFVCVREGVGGVGSQGVSGADRPPGSVSRPPRR